MTKRFVLDDGKALKIIKDKGADGCTTKDGADYTGWLDAKTLQYVSIEEDGSLMFTAEDAYCGCFLSRKNFEALIEKYSEIFRFELDDLFRKIMSHHDRYHDEKLLFEDEEEN